MQEEPSLDGAPRPLDAPHLVPSDLRLSKQPSLHYSQFSVSFKSHGDKIRMPSSIKESESVSCSVLFHFCSPMDW